MVRDILGKNQELENSVRQLEESNEEIEVMWEAEIDTRIRAEQILDYVEGELKITKRRIYHMQYHYRVSFWRVQDMMEYYPAELGQTRHIISRDLVTHLLSE